MMPPVWATGALAGVPRGDGALVWRVRLDDPQTMVDAGRATLSAEDLADLATRPDATMRGMRRRLARALLAQLSGVHPDRVSFGRSSAGAPVVIAPAGWRVSVAGRWPHALIGVARGPIGVDIEPAGAAPPPRDAFTTAERAVMRDDEALARWVAKEAHAKCLGIASRIAAEAIETRLDGAGFTASSADGASRGWFASFEDSVAAVALAG
ncbi:MULTISPECIES: 4'-phosphopantetheinyl transferase superfamily protein [unclassified Sphingomonas]|jgi:phosphopantetheinyl transferase|uniref:4'-phosphopantetheinyl transferase superfamily protein n=1 Tax=unclassified Sphingomonas TaxID=196159 RepID=UPI000E10DF90|nr:MULTISPECIES: 4'-phosphopantetheinyl transferase superfamily protein [unclassified Sphingomonas]AXJ95041.1 hypothetical protein DM480_05490 [Sphingomonas sp. FARSPH]